MAINEQIVTGRKFRKLIDETSRLWLRISFWTKASDVEFDDGKNAEEKFSELKKFVSDGKALLASAITGKRSTVASDATFEELADAVNNIKLGQGNAVVSDVLAGKTFTNDNGNLLTGTMPNRGAQIIQSGNNANNVPIPAGYHNGSGYVSVTNAYNAGKTAGYNDGYENGKSEVTLPDMPIHFYAQHTEGASYGGGGVSTFDGVIYLSPMSANGYNQLVINSCGDPWRALSFYKDTSYTNRLFTSGETHTLSYDYLTKTLQVSALYYKVENVSNNYDPHSTDFYVTYTYKHV